MPELPEVEIARRTLVRWFDGHCVARAEASKTRAQTRHARPIATQIVPAAEFHLAEDYHQRYLDKNPGGYTCHYMRD